MSTTLPHLQGLVFTTRDRPIRTQRGWSAAPVRHGVSMLALRAALHARHPFPRRPMMAGPTRDLTPWSAPTGSRTASPRRERSGGIDGSKIFGRLDCRAALRAIERGGYVSYRVFFADRATATRAGYRPCADCMPDAYRAWKDGQGGPSTPPSCALVDAGPASI